MMEKFPALLLEKERRNDAPSVIRNHGRQGEGPRSDPVNAPYGQECEPPAEDRLGKVVLIVVDP